MTCNCKADIEQRLTERYVAALPKSKDVKAVMTGYGLVITDDNQLQSRPFMPVEVRHIVTSKAGAERRKTDKVNMTFSFCPFCGTSLKSPDEEAK